MTAHSTRARRHGLGALGVAATLLVALASTASATTPPDSTTPADGVGGPCRGYGRRRRRGRPGGALRGGPGGGPGQPHRPARQLGQLRRHPAVVPRQVPRRRQPGADARRLLGRRAHGRRDLAAARTMPDSIDVGPPFALQAVEEGSGTRTSRPCGTRSPTALKDPDGNWVAAYYGIMAIGTNTTLVDNPPTDVRRPGEARSTRARSPSTVTRGRPGRRSPR